MLGLDLLSSTDTFKTTLISSSETRGCKSPFIHLAVLGETTKFCEVTSYGLNSNPECKSLNLTIWFIGFQGHQIISLPRALTCLGPAPIVFFNW